MKYVVFQSAPTQSNQLTGLLDYQLLVNGLGFPPKIEIPVWTVNPYGQIHKQIPNDNCTLFRSIGERLDISTLTAREAALDTLEGLPDETFFVVEGGGTKGRRGYELELREAIGFSNQIEPVTNGILTLQYNRPHISFSKEQLRPGFCVEYETFIVVGHQNNLIVSYFIPTMEGVDSLVNRAFDQGTISLFVDADPSKLGDAVWELNDTNQPFNGFNYLKQLEQMVIDPAWQPTTQA